MPKQTTQLNLSHFIGLSAQLSLGLRLCVSVVVLMVVWQVGVMVFSPPAFILPSPMAVLQVIAQKWPMFLLHTWVTAQAIILGLLLGLVLGLLFALSMVLFAPLHRWLLPILIASQAIPVFALAPILVIWLGYGLASKVFMAALIIFFPITVCCYDGLKNSPKGLLSLAQSMQATPWQLLMRVRLPAALPTMASGIRVAVVIAPIGAVAGEWVGSSAGLGYLMLQANARMQIDAMFAAMFILSLFAVGFYFLTHFILNTIVSWETQ